MSSDRPRAGSEALLLACMTWGRVFARRGVPILCYHRVADDAAGDISTVAPAVFREQMGWLQEWGFRIVGLEELVSLLACHEPVPRRSVVLTFDDGYESFYHEASETMRELGYTASVFVPTDYVSGAASWEEGLAGSGEKLLSWEQMGELAGAGFSFYPHGVTHRPLTQLTGPDLERELRESREVLEDRLGRPARVFCYPYGDCEARVEQAARAAGYDGACGLTPDVNWSAEQLWNLCRMQVLRTTTRRGFEARVTGAFRYYARLRSLVRGGADRRPRDDG
ncbi:MAG: polysaccharide deacetylase family protein [Armatimonadota bacterium]|nr:MAG: polysaccharide deacetylase family protein [Armatimonadota bacterium]